MGSSIYVENERAHANKRGGMKLRALLLSGYSLLFILLIIIGAISYRGLDSLVSTANWVTHTHEVIGEARLIEKTLVDMETGQRGFLITGTENFLEPYYAGLETYQRTIQDLKINKGLDVVPSIFPSVFLKKNLVYHRV